MRRCTAEPRSNTLIAVTFRSSSPPKRSRSRVRTVPENIRTYAIFSPAGPRSTLNTVPDSGPSASPAVAGSSSRDPGRQRVHAGARDRRAEEHRMDERPRGLRRELVAEPAYGTAVGSSTYAASSASS